MFGTSRSGASAYASVGIETGVAAASPHQLIVMLFDGALAAIASAQQRLHAEDVEGRGRAISKAIAIVSEGLRASLDKPAGGEIAESLDALYDYICRRLLLANLRAQPEPLAEAYRLLSELKAAWEAIAVPPPGTRYAAGESVPAASWQPPRSLHQPRSAP